MNNYSTDTHKVALQSGHLNVIARADNKIVASHDLTGGCDINYNADGFQITPLSGKNRVELYIGNINTSKVGLTKNTISIGVTETNYTFIGTDDWRTDVDRIHVVITEGLGLVKKGDALYFLINRGGGIGDMTDNYFTMKVSELMFKTLLG